MGAPHVHLPPPRDNGYVLTRLTRYARYGALTVLFNTIIAAGIVSTTHSCQKFGGIRYISDPASESTGVGNVVGPAAGNFVGSFFEGDPFGIAASVLSLATNAISTCFIGYRAWYGHGFPVMHIHSNYLVTGNIALLCVTTVSSHFWVVHRCLERSRSSSSPVLFTLLFGYVSVSYGAT